MLLPFLFAHEYMTIDPIPGIATREISVPSKPMIESEKLRKFVYRLFSIYFLNDFLESFPCLNCLYCRLFLGHFAFSISSVSNYWDKKSLTCPVNGIMSAHRLARRVDL